MLRSIVFCSIILLTSAIPDERTPYDLKYPANFGSRFTIPTDNPTTQEGVSLGRALFYEERLSANNRISCASCHQQKLAFTDGKKLSQGVDGSFTKRNSMSLANVLWVRNFFWDGRVEGLEAQAVVPLTDPHEMGQSVDTSAKKLQETTTYPPLFKKAFGTDVITGDNIVKAIAQFERTLISANSKYDKYMRGEYIPTESELHGLNLFSNGSMASSAQGAPAVEGRMRGGNCAHCHGTPKTFLQVFHNNGLDSLPSDKGRGEITGYSTDRGRFRVATLRNIALTGPYMHDGRFGTLEEVLDHYSEHIKKSESVSPFLAESLKLTTKEKSDLISFLNMLTDNDFVSNPEFSDPEPE